MAGQFNYAGLIADSFRTTDFESIKFSPGSSCFGGLNVNANYKHQIDYHLQPMLSQCYSPSIQAHPSTVLDEILADLNLLFRNEPSTSELLSRVQRKITVIGRSDLDPVLAVILNDERLLSTIARASYLQGNGFYKIVLYSGPLFALRLHVWLPNNLAEENLHSHRWPIVSTILAGVLNTEIWVDSAVSTVPYYDEYFYLGKDEELLSAGRTKVELAETRLSLPGDSYTLLPNELHRIIGNHEEMTATLMCRPAATRSWARNIVINSKLPTIVPTYMTPGELVDVLNIYRKTQRKSAEVI